VELTKIRKDMMDGAGTQTGWWCWTCFFNINLWFVCQIYPTIVFRYLIIWLLDISNYNSDWCQFGTFFLFPYIGNNHPNCYSLIFLFSPIVGMMIQSDEFIFFQMGRLNHQPATIRGSSVDAYHFGIWRIFDVRSDPFPNNCLVDDLVFGKWHTFVFMYTILYTICLSFNTYIYIHIYIHNIQ
jgi:hypothetical protein